MKDLDVYRHSVPTTEISIMGMLTVKSTGEDSKNLMKIGSAIGVLLLIIFLMKLKK